MRDARIYKSLTKPQTKFMVDIKWLFLCAYSVVTGIIILAEIFGFPMSLSFLGGMCAGLASYIWGVIEYKKDNNFMAVWQVYFGNFHKRFKNNRLLP